MSQSTRVHLVSNAHIDPVWIWNMDEGIGVTLSTFRCAADFCDEFDGFIFNHNESLLYEIVEQYDPALFKRIQKLITAGKWSVMGGWYLQPDCNMPRGEGIVRQILKGREYFRRKLGIEPKCAMNVDSFGHSRGIVQILSKSGQGGYVVCRPNQPFMALDHNQFRWVGYDGSEVIVSRIQERYGNRMGKAGEKIRNSLERLEGQDAVDGMAEVGSGGPQGGSMLKDPHLILLGVGNHGGGPSRVDLNAIAEVIEEKVDDDIFHSTLEKYYEELNAHRDSLPKIEHALNPWGPGCYTSMALIKKLYREVENEFFATERIVAHAVQAGSLSWPTTSFDQAERDMLLLQFHDMIPGSGVRSVEDYGRNLSGRALSILSELKSEAFFALSKGQAVCPGGEIPILVYNPHPHVVETEVECEYNLETHNFTDTWTLGKVYDDSGYEVPSQFTQEASYINVDWRKRVRFKATLQPMQMNRFQLKNERVAEKPLRNLSTLVHDQWTFGNDDYEIRFSQESGLVESLMSGGQNYLNGALLEPCLFKDDEDPWSVEHTSYEQTDERFTLLSESESARFSGSRKPTLPPLRVTEDGPVTTVIEGVFGYGNSRMLQKFRVPKKGNYLDVEIKVHWTERNRFLKLKVPFIGSNDDLDLRGETMFGSEPLDKSGREDVSQSWISMRDKKRDIGFGIINDRIYGSSYQKDALFLSLLRGPCYAAHTIFDRDIVPEGEYVDRIDAGEHTFRFRIVIARNSAALETLNTLAQVFSEPHYAMSYFPSGEGVKPECSAHLSDERLSLVTVKRSQADDGWIYRLFNPTDLSIEASFETMVTDAPLELVMAPFEVKTLKVDDSGNTGLVNLIEESIDA